MKNRVTLGYIIREYNDSLDDPVLDKLAKGLQEGFPRYLKDEFKREKKLKGLMNEDLKKK